MEGIHETASGTHGGNAKAPACVRLYERLLLIPEPSRGQEVKPKAKGRNGQPGLRDLRLPQTPPRRPARTQARRVVQGAGYCGASVSLYMIVFDGGRKHVEAASYGEAVALWNESMVDEFGPDSGWTGEDEPESVVLLDSEPVVRRP